MVSNLEDPGQDIPGFPGTGPYVRRGGSRDAVGQSEGAYDDDAGLVPDRGDIRRVENPIRERYKVIIAPGA